MSISKIYLIWNSVFHKELNEMSFYEIYFGKMDKEQNDTLRSRKKDKCVPGSFFSKVKSKSTFFYMYTML